MSNHLIISLSNFRSYSRQVCSHPWALSTFELIVYSYMLGNALVPLLLLLLASNIILFFITQITLSYRTSKKDSQVIINNIEPKPIKFTLHEDPTRLICNQCSTNINTLLSLHLIYVHKYYSWLLYMANFVNEWEKFCGQSEIGFLQENYFGSMLMDSLPISNSLNSQEKFIIE